MLVFQESAVDKYLYPELMVLLHKQQFTLIGNIDSHNKTAVVYKSLALCAVSA